MEPVTPASAAAESEEDRAGKCGGLERPLDARAAAAAAAAAGSVAMGGQLKCTDSSVWKVSTLLRLPELFLLRIGSLGCGSTVVLASKDAAAAAAACWLVPCIGANGTSPSVSRVP